jgi:hypothetical protein
MFTSLVTAAIKDYRQARVILILYRRFQLCIEQFQAKCIFFF